MSPPGGMRREDSFGDLGPPPPVFRIRRQSTGAERFRPWFILGLILFGAVLLAGILKGLLVEWVWFDSVGYISVYRTMVIWRTGLFLAGAAIFLLFWIPNVLIALRSQRSRGRTLIVSDPRAASGAGLAAIVTAFAIVGSLGFGSAASGQWDVFLSFINQVPVDQTDPVFGRQIGFYLFELPILHFVHGWLMWLVVLTTISVAVVRLFLLAGQSVSQMRMTVARIHFSLMATILLLLVAAKYWLDRFDLLYSTHGTVFGATYTDIHARLPMLTILTVLTLIVGIVVVAGLLSGRVRIAIAVVAVWAIGALLFQEIYPSTVQRFEVQPNELSRETPYIERNIQFTRFAYGLDRIVDRNYPATGAVTASDLQSNSETVRSIRLWDHRPLLETFNQTQSLRPLYRFTDVDIDRYVINGTPRQVMVSPRELVIGNLAAQARTWVNERLQFTHGYGLVMTPVNEVVEEGLPTYFLRDIPVQGSPPVTRPEIYFGESTDHYVVVKTGEAEFDYPRGESNATTVYDSDRGISLRNPLTRLLFAWHFGDSNLVLSQQLREESLLLYRRDVVERARAITPFLRFDSDPYVVVDNGRVFWILDGFTTSNRYPYSQPNSSGENYIRNSVKTVIDAYDGTTTYYLIDQADPIASVYSRTYPDLFRPLDEMPSGLRAHLRYPEQLFLKQIDMYRLYHIRDPRVFYNKEDVWAIPSEILDDKPQPIEPYFVIMRLPGEAQPEFVLMMPLTPNGRQNTVAWIAARMDDPHYGEVLSFRFPTESLVFGPAQIETRIDQAPAISQQFSLWNQSGSRVVRGNLLMIPIGSAILYVEPIYLRAESNQLPELKRIVAVTGSSIAMESTLEQALAAVTGSQAPTPPVTPQQPGTSGQAPSSSVGDLAKQARDAYDRAQDRLRQGDFAGYGREIQQLDALLNQLQQATQQ